MNFIIIGSGGGLGSYLYQNLLTADYKAIGLDISDGESVTYKINDSDSLPTLITSCLSTFNGPTAIIVTIAPQKRLKKHSDCENTKDEILKHLSTTPKILLDAANCLSCTSQNFDDSSHIINIGSILSERFSTNENPAYGASKAACKSLVRDLSLLLSHKNINVNSISPALLYRNKKSLDFLLERLQRHPSNCQPTSYSDIYKLVQFICCSGIQSLRGQDITLDHGLESIESFDLLNYK